MSTSTGSDPVENAAEEAKGRVKQAVGALTGSDDLRDEGRAQQEKAEKEREAAAKQAEADRARAEADKAEAEQRASQNG